MAKKGFFSWLGFGKNKDQQDTAEEQKQAEQPAIESEIESGSAEVEKALEEQQAKLAAEAEAAERARLAAEAEAAEQARLAVEKKARLAAEEEAAEQARLAEEAAEAAKKAEKAPKKGFFARLKQGLLKTRQNLGSGFFGLFSGKKIDDELFEELETQLLTADLGVETTLSIIDNLTRQASRRQLKDGEALYELLKEEMGQILDKVDKPLVIDSEHKPYVILMVGVNGVGNAVFEIPPRHPNWKQH